MILIIIGLFILACTISFFSGRRFERDLWSLCQDCGDVLSMEDIIEQDRLCSDCRRKLWGDMAQ